MYSSSTNISLLLIGAVGTWDGAGDEIRTHDPNHGKVVLYQLSYARVPPGYLTTELKVSE